MKKILLILLITLSLDAQIRINPPIVQSFTRCIGGYLFAVVTVYKSSSTGVSMVQLKDTNNKPLKCR